MKTRNEIITQYVKAVVVFLLLVFLCKTVETFYLIKSGEEITFYCFLKSILSLLIACCFYSTLLFPIPFIFIFNKIAAKIFISVVFSFLILLETGLTVYFFNTGSLLGAELFIRPFSEVAATIEATVNIWIPIFAIILTITLFYFLLSFFNKRTFHKKTTLSIAITILVISSFFAIIPKLTTGTKNPTTKNYIQNKSFYCFHSLKNYWMSEHKYSDVSYEHEKITAFLQDNPERKTRNKYYPLERKYENVNVLAPYFKPDTIKPNIVIFVLESLGREWTTPNQSDLSFTPFFDSLANTGLYWKNCISTTRRSFGAVPSLTGSLPFGVKGFQFGNMPDHNSLIKVLKENNYKTNAFYAGAFYFDAVNDYLLAQNIDYMSENFYIDYENNKTELNGVPYWGYHDSAMYAKVVKDPNFLNDTIPYFNLFITTSAHQPADKNNPFFARAYKLVEKIILSAPKEKQEYYKKKINHATAILYQDLCLKDFFENYQKRNDFENTIFVFTGDHSSGMMQKNDLSAFHVPLIIWSPLLLNHKTFPALVSHNDVVPTIEALLKEHYHLTSTPNIHWLGNHLDTSSVFVSNVKTVMFDYSNGYKDIIYNNYYYNHQLFEIQNENLDLTEISNDSIKELMQNKLDLYKYIHKYVYLNNKLTTSPLFEKPTYQTINDISKDTVTILFESTPEWKSITLYPQTSIEGKWKKIKISITGEIKFLSIPENQQYFNYMILCDGQNMKNANYYTDGITKTIMVDDIEIEKWYPLHIENQFSVEDVTDINVKIYFSIGENKPINHSKMRNIKILTEGEETK